MLETGKLAEYDGELEELVKTDGSVGVQDVSLYLSLQYLS